MDNRDLTDLLITSRRDRDSLFQRFLSDWLAKDIQVMKKQLLKSDTQVLDQLRQIAPDDMAELEE